MEARLAPLKGGHGVEVALPLLWSVLLLTSDLAAGSVHSHHHHHLLVKDDHKDELRNGFLEVNPADLAKAPYSQGPPGCAGSSNPSAASILAGNQKAYAFGGIPEGEQCGEGYGCTSNYWSQWCRWRHGSSPQCPQEVQEDLQQRLRDAAAQGHVWARNILLLQPCEIWPYMEGRTLWIIGDSVSKDFAFSFQCFMLEYWDKTDTGRWPENQSSSPNVSEDQGLMHDLLTELTKQEADTWSKPWYMQWCVPMYKNTRMCFLRANLGSFVADNLMPLMPRLAKKEDLVLFNFGLHSNDNGSMIGYLDELERFGEVYQRYKAELPTFLWRQTSVQHFTTPIGEWVPDKPQEQQRCAPIKGVEIRPDGSIGPDGDPALAGIYAADMTPALDTLLKGGRRNVRSDALMQRLGIPVVHVWNQSVTFWDYHRFYHDPEEGSACAKIDCDCTHVCLPSWHQLWLAELQASLASVGPVGGSRKGGRAKQQIRSMSGGVVARNSGESSTYNVSDTNDSR